MENAKQLIAFVKKNPNATKADIVQATGLKGIVLFNLLKKLQTEGAITETIEGEEKLYSLAEQSNEPPKEEIETEEIVTAGRDNSKLKFNGELYGKGPLVRAVVAQYVTDNPGTTYKKLKEVFPDGLLKRFGIFQDEETANRIAPKGGRYFTKPEQMIKLKDKKVVVCNQFTLTNIQPFLKAAKDLGYKIK